MASPADVLMDAFGRIRDTAHAVLDGLTREQLTYRIDGRANSIAWLAWHATRVQDSHVAEVAGTEQVWTAAGWARRFDLPFDDSATGYGHSSDEVAAVQTSADLLVGYLDAVADRTEDFLRGLTDGDLDRVVDENWDPPVTLAVRLVSVVDDDLQHMGQAAFVRGLVAAE
jgi:uncharacterized damage-inducible protein DinB